MIVMSKINYYVIVTVVAVVLLSLSVPTSMKSQQKHHHKQQQQQQSSSATATKTSTSRRHHSLHSGHDRENREGTAAAAIASDERASCSRSSSSNCISGSRTGSRGNSNKSDRRENQYSSSVIIGELPVSQLIFPRKDYLESVKEDWKMAAGRLEDFAYPFKRPLIQILDTVSNDNSLAISNECRSSLKSFSHRLSRSERDAITMLDSFSKFIPGMLTRNRNSDFGAYDQCLKVKGSRYVLINLLLPLPPNSRDFEAVIYQKGVPGLFHVATTHHQEGIGDESEDDSRMIIGGTSSSKALSAPSLQQNEDEGDEEILDGDNDDTTAGGDNSNSNDSNQRGYNSTAAEAASLLRMHQDKKRESFSSSSSSSPQSKDGGDVWYHQDYSMNYRDFYSSQPIVAGCLPAACREQEIRHVLESSTSVIAKMISPLRFKVRGTEVLSEEESSFPESLEVEYPFLPLLRIFSRCVLLLLVATTVISTLIGLYYPFIPFTGSIISCFDAVKNTEKLLRIERSPVRDEHDDPDMSSLERLRFFNGIKSAYMLVATAGHFLLPMNFELFVYYHEIRRLMVQNPFLNMMTKSSSTFFSLNVLLASSLSVITWLPEMKKKKTSSTKSTVKTFLSFVVLRILRTLPVTIACLLFVFSLPLFPPGSGPNMKQIQGNMTANCLKNGWKELMFVSNHQQPSDVCIMVGWYLSADFQLYVGSFVVIFLLSRSPSLGLKLVWTVILIGPVIQFLMMHFKDITPVITMFSFEGNSRILADNVVALHFNSFNYISTYGVGLFLGYLISSRITINKKYHSLVWMTCWPLLGFLLQLCSLLYQGEKFVSDSRLTELLFGSLIRTALSAACFGLMLNAFSDPKSRWTRFFSSRVFTILARLSFSIFMVHPFVIIFLLGTRGHSVDFDTTYFNMFSLYMYLTSFILGYLVFLVVEAPFVNLIKSSLKSSSGRGCPSSSSSSSSSLSPLPSSPLVNDISKKNVLGTESCEKECGNPFLSTSNNLLHHMNSHHNHNHSNNNKNGHQEEVMCDSSSSETLYQEEDEVRRISENTNNNKNEVCGRISMIIMGEKKDN